MRTSSLVFAASALVLGCTGEIAGPAVDPAYAPSGSGAQTATGGSQNPGSGGTAQSSGGSGNGAGQGSGAAGGAVGSGGSAAGSGGGSAGSGGSGVAGTPPGVFGSFARLTQAEYGTTVERALGVTPDASAIPVDGRIGVYTSNASVSPDPVHPYLLAAEDIAGAVIPGDLPACEADEASSCLRASYQEPIEVLLRRDVTAAELDAWAAMLESVVDAGGSATDATRAVLASVLLSPDFLFRASPVADTDTARARRLAEGLSYALWDAPPDTELAEVAEVGSNELSAALRAQAARLTSDARATPVMARFLAQWLHVDTDLRLGDAEFATSPRFLELLAYVEDALANATPVSDFIRGRRGFVHKENVDAYGLDSVSGSGDVVAVDWPASSPRRGLIAEDLFADATRHPDAGRRPIFRGKLVRTTLLCDEVEAPSADLLALADEVMDRTVDPRCRGCHLLLDPIGGAFAALDQDHDGAVPAAEIVDHPELEGSYADLPDLLDAVAGSRAFAECFARNWLAFFLEQPLDAADPAWVAELAELVQAGASLGEVAEQTVVTLESRARAVTPWCEGP